LLDLGGPGRDSKLDGRDQNPLESTVCNFLSTIREATVAYISYKQPSWMSSRIQMEHDRFHVPTLAEGNGRRRARGEAPGGFACLVEHHPYFAALWHFGDKTFCAFFGGGRAPLSGMGLAILAGLGCGLYYSRKRLWVVYGMSSPSASAAFYQRNPWRQVIVTALAGAVLVTSMPTAAYAGPGTPDYDPVFYYYHPDHLGSSQLMTDRDGDVVQQYGYSPFGREDYKNNTLAFSVSDRYTGQTLDEETGLYYYGARYYDPELARFIQADSTIPDAEFSQAYNRYAYVYNNPLKFTDPSGQFPWVAVAVIMKAYAAMGMARSVCVAIKTGDFRGLALGLVCSLVGGTIGGAVGGFIGGGSQLAVALGGAIGAASLTVAVSGGNIARAIGEAVVWAYISYYCKVRAEGTTACEGESSAEEQHLREIDTTLQTKPVSTPANFESGDAMQTVMNKLEHFLKGLKAAHKAGKNVNQRLDDIDDFSTLVSSTEDADVKAAYDRLVERHGKGVLKDMIKAIAIRAGAGSGAGAIAETLIKVGETAGDLGNAFARGLEIANAGTVTKNVATAFIEWDGKMPNGYWWPERSGNSFGYGYYRNDKLYAVSLTTVKRGFVGNIFRTIGVIKDKPKWVATRVRI
jgi:RHS repeat-associated protein